MSFIVKIKKQLALYELTVDLETEAGILAVIGGSGSGKSMTLKCIAGIETPDSGFISLNGRVLYDSSKKINLPPQKRNVGYLFQEYALFPTMTAAENISIVMKQKNPVQVQKWLEEYGLGDPEQAENGLGGAVQPCGQTPGRQGLGAGLPGDVQGGPDDLLPGESDFRRHKRIPSPSR